MKFDTITRLDDDTFIASSDIGTYLGMIMSIEGNDLFKWVRLPSPQTTQERNVDLYKMNDDLKLVRIEDPKKVLG